jgi:hypothetical protein
MLGLNESMAVSKSLFLLLNHPLTSDQEADARESLGVGGIVEPPDRVRDLWAKVPPEIPTLDEHLAPVRAWLREHARPGDPVLIQGDFGATWLMVRFALETGLVPVYSTTRRSAVQEPQPDGSVRLIHHFRHVRFRNYGG